MKRNKTFEQFVSQIGSKITPSKRKVKNSIEKIENDLFDYTKKAGLDSLVLGVSGGLDSAVVAAIASRVCKKLNIKLIGISIPLSSTNSHKEQARWVGETYCDAFDEISSWEEDFYEVNKTAHEMVSYVVSTTDRVAAKAGFDTNNFDRSIEQANIKSRLRMITLYALAKNTNGMVLGTGNWSEDHAIFFYTLGGDGQVDYSPIKGVGKGFEMPIFAEELGIRKDIIEQNPSDGLKVSTEDTDEAQIGASYKEIDIIIGCYKKMFNEDILNEFESYIDNEKVKKVILRHNKFKYKENGEISIEKGSNGLPIDYKTI